MKSNRLRYHLVLLILLLLPFFSVDAKRYRFKIDSPREVYITRSAKAGFKMVEVIAYGRNADKAIEKAKMDAVVALTFFGASGTGEMGSIPAILLGGRKEYDNNRKFFDKFFKKGQFMSYVEDVNSSYPTGSNNIKTSRGRRVRIILLVDWNGLAKYYKETGLKTAVSELSEY